MMRAYLWRYLLFVLFMPTLAYAQPPVVADGEIRGTVKLRGGEVGIPNVTVRLIGTERQTLTDTNGKFRFDKLQPGTYTLTATAAGARPVSGVVTVKSEELAEVKLEIKREVFTLEEIEVLGQQMQPRVGKQTLRAKEIKRVPGTVGDVLRALQVLPGIGVGNDWDSILYIRGGPPGDNRFYFDRLSLFYPYHWGGVTSTIHSDVPSQIDVYAGGFGAEFGTDAQAVIDIVSRRGRTDRVGAKFDVNMLYTEGLLEGPLGKRGSWYLAGRRSYIDLFFRESDIDGLEVFPRFWDYQTKVSYTLSEKHQLYFNAFASNDLMAFDFDLTVDSRNATIGDDPTLGGIFRFKDTFNAQGVHLRSTFTDQLVSDLSLSRTNYLRDFRVGDLSLRRRPVQYELREDLTYRLNPKHQLESGVLFSTTEWALSNFFPRPPDEGDPNAQLSFDNPFLFWTNLQFYIFEPRIKQAVNKRFNFIEGYVQHQYTPWTFLSATLGLRLDYFNLTETVSVQPRGRLQFKIRNGSEIRFALGRYQISPYPWQIAPGLGNPDVKESNAVHYIAEAEHQLTPRISLKLTAYHKDFSELITRDVPMVYLNQGSGFARGVEFSVEHRLSERFFGYANYAYSVSKRRDRPSEPIRHYSFDQTHVATLIASYKPARAWELGVQWQYHSGNPYTPVVGVERVLHPVLRHTRFAPVYASTNSGRLPPFHRLDIRLSKSIAFRHWQLSVFFAVFNVYSHKNVLGYFYEFGRYHGFGRRSVNNPELKILNEPETLLQMPRIPYLGITAEF